MNEQIWKNAQKENITPLNGVECFDEKQASNKGGCLMWKSIHHSQTIFNYLMELKLCQMLSRIAIGHIMSILIAMFSRGYWGKMVNFALCSNHHHTTIGHFLNYGKWKDEVIQNSLKQMVIRVIYQEAKRSGQPIFCIVDDTIASRTKPSSQALHPIENAYFHQPHFKKKQDYGHQAIAVLLSCKRKSWPIIKNVEALRLTSVSTKQNYLFTNAKSVVLRASKDSGSWHLLPITFVVWLQVDLWNCQENRTPRKHVKRPERNVPESAWPAEGDCPR